MRVATSLQIAWSCVLLTLSGGCSHQQSGIGKVLYSEGCVLYVDGITTTNAAEIYKEWRMKGCEIVITNEVGKD